ncbi:hypothetical protein MTsPCn9_24960 [Croceitalea sp. MTPC9]|uniref:serine hydrolase domain-containing protein n=1 Tax=unclassified Croceitalea TaxID=2632280 RepID=UPI002B36710B|nr:hypothetical protein MTsPCn6_29570 [Croceitalea sp. MTPC6]GMN17558.1 hypothetical protein MTsPCn9_24960 [Croceitalea sp. MTPC9]
MKQLPLLLALFFMSNFCQAQIRPSTLNDRIDEYVLKISNRYGIPGAAVAIAKDGKTVHEAYYGNANIEHDVPVSDKSIFRVYSLTKTIVTVAVFQLIEKNKLSLEDKLSMYLDDIPKTWGTIQLKHLLTHSSGLPDMAPIMDFENLTEEEAVEKVIDQEISFLPGEKYDYNQTNFWLVQRVVEKVTNENIEDYILRNQFWDDVDNTTFLSSDSRDIVKNRVTPYFPFRNGKLIIDNSYLQGSYMLSANGLNLTLKDYVEWNKKFEENKFLSEKTKNKMFEFFDYGNDNKEFVFGWDVHNLNGHFSYGFSGSLVTAYRIFPKDNISIIFLSNGLESYYNIENTINHLASLVNDDIYDGNNFVFEGLLDKASNESFEKLFSYYNTLKNNKKYKQVDFENCLNSIGYMLFRLGNQNTALKVFELNTREYPKSWNVWDSLAEGNEYLGNKTIAILNYEKSLALNPDNKHAIERLKVLRTK